ncbi:hypothetical protein [uncultured Sphingomonas sp.]
MIAQASERADQKTGRMLMVAIAVATGSLIANLYHAQPLMP